MAEHDFETVTSETIYVGKIFALRADEVRMPGGSTAKREVVEHFGAVAVLAIDEENNIVLVYQYRHPLGRRLWELPVVGRRTTLRRTCVTAMAEASRQALGGRPGPVVLSVSEDLLDEPMPDDIRAKNGRPGSVAPRPTRRSARSSSCWPLPSGP